MRKKSTAPRGRKTDSQNDDPTSNAFFNQASLVFDVFDEAYNRTNYEEHIDEYAARISEVYEQAIPYLGDRNGVMITNFNGIHFASVIYFGFFNHEHPDFCVRFSIEPVGPVSANMKLE